MKISWLKYRLVTPETVDFNKAPTLRHNSLDFELELADGVATFSMLVDVSTEEEARKLVDPFIEAWQIASGITNDPGDFRLEFTDAHIVERNPKSGHAVLITQTLRLKMTFFDAVLRVSRVKYPDPPTDFKISTLVSAMYYQYEGFRAKRMTLGAAAYFCLDMLEHSTRASTKKRPAAAHMYSIDKDVLDKMGNLTSNAGGQEARKADGYARPHTPMERRWLETAMRLLIRRAGEYEAHPGKLVQITMNDLP